MSIKLSLNEHLHLIFQNLNSLGAFTGTAVFVSIYWLSLCLYLFLKVHNEIKVSLSSVLFLPIYGPFVLLFKRQKAIEEEAITSPSSSSSSDDISPKNGYVQVVWKCLYSFILLINIFAFIFAATYVFRLSTELVDRIKF